LFRICKPALHVERPANSSFRPVDSKNISVVSKKWLAQSYFYPVDLSFHPVDSKNIPAHSKKWLAQLYFCPAQHKNSPLNSLFGRCSSHFLAAEQVWTTRHIYDSITSFNKGPAFLNVIDELTTHCTPTDAFVKPKLRRWLVSVKSYLYNTSV
jgi:hypothetical protein